MDGELEGDSRDVSKRRPLVPVAPAFVDHHEQALDSLLFYDGQTGFRSRVGTERLARKAVGLFKAFEHALINDASFFFGSAIAEAMSNESCTVVKPSICSQ